MSTKRYSNVATVTINPKKVKDIQNARENGDFDSVKRLSKKELENSQSDANPLEIMNEIAHMYLDSFLIWVHEMEKIGGTINYEGLHNIVQDLENPNTSTGYTQFIREMKAADPEEVRNKFLSVNDDMGKIKEALKDELL